MRKGNRCGYIVGDRLPKGLRKHFRRVGGRNPNGRTSTVGQWVDEKELRWRCMGGREHQHLSARCHVCGSRRPGFVNLWKSMLTPLQRAVHTGGARLSR